MRANIPVKVLSPLQENRSMCPHFPLPVVDQSRYMIVTDCSHPQHTVALLATAEPLYLTGEKFSE